MQAPPNLPEGLPRGYPEKAPSGIFKNQTLCSGGWLLSPKEYHRLNRVSLLSSEWDQVGPRRRATRTECLTLKKYVKFTDFLTGLRLFSTPRLNALPHLHLEPINVVVFHESMIPNLGVGFPLRCFQRLSRPDLATQQCSWRNSWQTRGQFFSILSY